MALSEALLYRGIKPQEGTGAPRVPLTCHCEERSDVAISQYPAASWKAIGENAAAFPRLHPKGTSSRASRSGRHVGLRPPPAMTNLRASRHRMRTAKSCQSAWRSLSAATDQLVRAILTIACTGRECAAGRGQPGPYSALREAMGKLHFPLSIFAVRREVIPEQGISSNPGRAPMPRRGSDCSRPDCAPRSPRASARCPAAGSARPTGHNTSRFP